jgi:hypothetical protein
LHPTDRLPYERYGKFHFLSECRCRAARHQSVDYRREGYTRELHGAAHTTIANVAFPILLAALPLAMTRAHGY